MASIFLLFWFFFFFISGGGLLWGQNPNTTVSSVLSSLGESLPVYLSKGFEDEQIRMGKELIIQGYTQNSGGKKSASPVSSFFLCTDCHNTTREDPDLKQSNPETRLDYVQKHQLPLLQGTTFYGIVNRESWYNGDYEKKYGSLVSKARQDLKEAIQVCSEHCSQGRRLEGWELDAVLAYFVSLQYKLNDLALSKQDYQKLSNSQGSKKETINWLKSFYLNASPATFGEVPKDPKKGYELSGNPQRGKAVFESSCLSCHTSDHLQKYATPFPETKETYQTLHRLLKKNGKRSGYHFIREGTHPESPNKAPYMPNFTLERLSNQQIEDLKAYLEGKATTPDSQEIQDFPVDQSTPKDLAGQVRAIFERSCEQCHNTTKTRGGFSQIMNFEYLKTNSLKNYIVPKHPEKSFIYEVITRPEDQEGFMPEIGNPLTTEEIAVIREWILQGASEKENTGQTVFKRIEYNEVLKAMIEDIAQVDEYERPQVRYLTLTHLYNLDEQERQFFPIYRHALFKLLNSLSQNHKIVLPQEVAKTQRTTFRLMLNHYDWNLEKWQAIERAYPYLIELDEIEDLARRTHSRVPVVRLDWLAKFATIEPLYSILLGHPNNAKLLEKQLGVNVRDNIYSGEVARVGIGHGQSGVSKNNRIFERHPIKFRRGGYWKSYDFASSGGQQGIFENPFGPKDIYPNRANVFEHNGGEIIYHLPNGFQAYMLVDQKDEVIPDGPTSIVSDKTNSNDPVVRNAISCMSCHYGGLKIQTDQTIKKAEKSLTYQEIVELERIYASEDKIKKWFKEDNEFYQEALKRATVLNPKNENEEQIRRLVYRFEENVRFAQAVEELGVDSKVLEREFYNTTDRELKVIGASLRDAGIDRNVFIEKFRKMAKALGLKVYVPSNSKIIGQKEPMLSSELEKWLNLLQTGTSEERKEAAHQLGKSKVSSEACKLIVPKLIEAMKDSEWGVRCNACDALKNVGKEDSRTVPAIREVALNDENKAVRAMAKSVYKKLTGEELKY